MASSSTSTLKELTVASALTHQSVSRQLAMSIPTIERARDVLTGIIASLPLRYWARRPVDVDDAPVEPEPWMIRPDPDKTMAFTLAWTVDDLLFYPRAFWRIRSRNPQPNDFPTAFQWMPFYEVSLRTDPPGVPWGQVVAVHWRGEDIPPRDVVVFDGLGPGLLAHGWRAINIALKLDEAAERFAGIEIPAGWLQQESGEEMDADELEEAADRWNVRRRVNSTGALGIGFKYHEGQQTPERLQLTQSRQHQALELSRLMNVPPWIVGAPTGSSMTYQNAMQARLDLIDFGALPQVTVLEQTLSGPNVVPTGRYVTVDTDAWLRNPFLSTPGVSIEDEPPPPGDTPKEEPAEDGQEVAR